MVALGPEEWCAQGEVLCPFDHGSGNNAPMSGGRAERPPNDDREREFVNSKSNYLGEITFRGD